MEALEALGNRYRSPKTTRRTFLKACILSDSQGLISIMDILLLVIPQVKTAAGAAGAAVGGMGDGGEDKKRQADIASRR
jgi:hypothetical protein